MHTVTGLTSRWATVSEARLSPSQPVTRAEMATFLTRALNLSKDSS